ncbi:DUF2795 domain-containing protein [Nonomuraea salmonea]
MESEPRVTVVVVSRDRVRTLTRTLPLHPRPVILVDNGSGDGTAGFVRRHFPDVHVVEAGRNLGAPGRNLGVELAGTPYVAFADDDSWWAPKALERAADVLDAHPRLAVLGARVLVGPDERLDTVSERMRDSPLGTEPGMPGPSVLGFLACGVVVRRDAFLEAGGFDDVVFFFGEEERLALDLAALGWGAGVRGRGRGPPPPLARPRPRGPPRPGRQERAADGRAAAPLAGGGAAGVRRAARRPGGPARSPYGAAPAPRGPFRTPPPPAGSGTEPTHAGKSLHIVIDGHQRVMTTAPNPIDLQKHLSGVDYPASKQDLIKAAREHNASNDIVKALEAMPDREYDGPNAVSQAITKR